MKRSVIFLVLLLCGAIGLLIVLRSPLPGQQYKGRALASWVADLGRPGAQEAAREAIVEGGTNLVPGLLEIRFARDARLDLYVKFVGSRFNSSFRTRREALRYCATEALRLLGTNAGFAILPLFGTNNLLLTSSSNSIPVNPFLFERQSVSELAEVMLYDLQTNAVPAFIAGLQGSNLLVRFNLCYALASKRTVEVHENEAVARELIAAVTPSLAIVARPATPTSPLEGPLLSMALHALLQLGARHHDQELIIPQVIALLGHPDSGVRYNAAHFLKELAPKTELVRSALQQALDKEKENPSGDTTGVMMIGPRSKEVLLGGFSDALQANQ